MAKTNDHLVSLLMDVALEGTVTIEKRKLLWLMGKSHDRPSAWAALLEHWEEIGQEADELSGLEVNSKIVLVRGAPEGFVNVSDWADS